MRLGITSLNYARWFGEARPEASGRLPLYFPTQSERVPQAESLAWSIRKARSLGVPVLADPIHRWREPGYVEAMADLAAASGVEIEPWMAPNYMATGDEAKQVADTVVAFMRRVCRPLGATILGTAQVPMLYHRWLDSPSLAEQLERYATNLQPVARAAESEGITLALENHCDYWAAELRQLKEMVASPALRFRLDTGNQWLVMEDPVRAAEVLADDVVTVHLKDVRIIPFCADGAKVVGAPLGRGHVDLRRILTILRERGVSPDTMPLVIETSWTPSNEDPARWTEESVLWARENLTEFLG